MSESRAGVRRHAWKALTCGVAILGLVLIAPLVADDGIVSFFHALFFDGEVLIPEREIPVDGARPPDHFFFKLHRESMPHIDHDAVDPE